jgi:hypothetical protein
MMLSVSLQYVVGDGKIIDAVVGSICYVEK